MKNTKKNHSISKVDGMLDMKHGQIATHGECTITRRVASNIPATAKRVGLQAETLIVAPSETTGNHHFCTLPEGAEAWQDGDKFYLNSPRPFKVACVQDDRHDTMEFAPGKYEFGCQQEFDPFTARLNNVRD